MRASPSSAQATTTQAKMKTPIINFFIKAYSSNTNLSRNATVTLVCTICLHQCIPVPVLAHLLPLLTSRHLYCRQFESACEEDSLPLAPNFDNTTARQVRVLLNMLQTTQLRCSICCRQDIRPRTHRCNDYGLFSAFSIAFVTPIK